MEQSLQKYYEEQFSMMSTDGWKDLMDDLSKLKVSINDLSLVTDTQDLFFRKGQLDILDLLLSRHDTCEKVFQELQEESK